MVRQRFFHLVFFWLSLFFVFTAFAETPHILKPDEAFILSSEIHSPTQFTLTWKIAPGYHLYSDMISIKTLAPDNAKLGSLDLPKGVPTYEASRGNFMAYYHELVIPVQVLGGDIHQLKIEVTYQGCADIGLCFPPQHKTLTLDSQLNLHALVEDSTNLQNIEDILHAKNPGIVLLSFFIFGILLSLTPCVFPMLPILSSIIASHGHNITSRRAFSLSFVYVFFSALTYAVLGIIAGVAGHHLQSALQNTWVLILSGLLFIVLAFSLFGLYELRLPHFLQNRLTQFSHQHTSGSLLGVALMGIFSTLIVSPCVSAPLVGALAYIGDTGSAALGGLALFTLGFGMGIPLLIIGSSAGKLLPKAGAWMSGIKNFFGILLVAMAIWIWSRFLADEITIALWSILAVTCAVCLGAFEAAKSPWERFCKALGIILGIYGIALFLGAISGSTNMLQPLEKLVRVSEAQKSTDDPSHSTTSVYAIENTKDLDNALLKHQRLLVDVYADWCVACKKMADDIFANPLVQKTLEQEHVQVAQINLTDPSPEVQALIQKYHVVAPPTILFFDQHGDWLSNATMVGEQSREDFLAALKEIYPNNAKK